MKPIPGPETTQVNTIQLLKTPRQIFSSSVIASRSFPLVVSAQGWIYRLFPIRHPIDIQSAVRVERRKENWGSAQKRGPS